MATKVSYCQLLGTTPEYIVDTIYDLNFNGLISANYIKQIAYKIAEDVAQDIYETADREDWNCDDVRLAFGRVLCKKLKIEI